VITIKEPIPRNEKFPPQQTDIVIEPGGKIHISFLWDDLREIAGRLVTPDDGLATHEENFLRTWHPPELDIDPVALKEYETCRLCPKQCGFDRLNKTHSSCGDFRLRVSNFGITHGDEPEIRGTKGSGAIMLTGCPLKCPSCHNPEKVAEGIETSPRKFLALCQALQEKGAHNIQILSPTVHLPMLRIILKMLKKSAFPCPILLKSSGYESVEQIRSLAGLVDIYLPDFKFGSCSQWSKRAGVKDYFEKASAAVNEMINQVGPLVCDEAGIAKKGVLVRHVQAPLPEEEKIQIQTFMDRLPEGVRTSLQNNFVSLD